MLKNIIVWDLGATKCAAAIVEYDDHTQEIRCKKIDSVKIRSYESLHDLSYHLEKKLGLAMSSADAICIGAAGQYDGNFLHLDKGHPNQGYPYPMGFAQLAKEQHWPKFEILHDYSPIVCATFTSYLEESENVKYLAQTEINPHGRRVALGVGTGVGMKDGVLLNNGDFWLGTNEIGHIGISSPPRAQLHHQKRHREFIKFLRSDGILLNDEPLTFEKILAGNGIVRIHSFLNAHKSDQTAEEIGDLVREGLANETQAMFAWYMGLLVGTVQLSFMPDGGIWITGGVALNHLNIFDHEEFWLGIDSSPSYLKLRKKFPLGVLCGSHHAFMGGAYYASKRLLAS